MNIEEVREYCLSLKNTTESLPFDDESLVFKVENKMYLLVGLGATEEPHVAVKCDPEQADALRERYAAVAPAYHFNKKYWNDIYLNRDMPSEEIRRWILHSYREVLRKLPAQIRERYESV
jgi:predicted DNA-binding protein (MmcQ/YjbR family)